MDTEYQLRNPTYTDDNADSIFDNYIVQFTFEIVVENDCICKIILKIDCVRH